MNSITNEVYTKSTKTIKNAAPYRLSLRHRLPCGILRELHPEPSEGATRRARQLWPHYPEGRWTRHQDGFKLLVPEGGERFFDLIRKAILRNPSSFAYASPHIEAICDSMSLPEVEKLLAWVEDVCCKGMSALDAESWNDWIDGICERTGPSAGDVLAPTPLLFEWSIDRLLSLRRIAKERRSTVLQNGSDSFIGMNGESNC